MHGRSPEGEQFDREDIESETETREPISEQTLQRLKDTFVGKRVNITHEGDTTLSDETGICKAFRITESSVDMELTNRHRIGFIPERMTPNSIGCDMSYAVIRGRRKIQLAG